MVCSVGSARAETCTGTSSTGKKFPICFDPGNRLFLTGGTEGYGGGIAVRHIIHFVDEPDLVWKMEHQIAVGEHAAFESRFSGRLYRGVYVRHSRDGHVVLPFGDPPAKIFLPFDVGAIVEVGTLTWRPDMTATLGVVKTAALIDVARSRDHKLRLAFGPVGSWDMQLTRDPVVVQEQLVSPFTSGLADVKVESSNGLEAMEVRFETGYALRNTGGWQMVTRAEASVDRVVLSVNDRPLELTAGVRYDSLTDETTAGVGLRLALYQRSDPRVAKLAQ